MWFDEQVRLDVCLLSLFTFPLAWICVFFAALSLGKSFSACSGAARTPLLFLCISRGE